MPRKPTGRPTGRPPKPGNVGPGSAGASAPANLKRDLGSRPVDGTIEAVIFAQARLDAEIDRPKPNRWKLVALTAGVQNQKDLLALKQALPQVQEVPAPVTSQFDKLGSTRLTPEEAEAARETERKESEEAKRVRVQEADARAERLAAENVKTQKLADNAEIEKLRAEIKLAEDRKNRRPDYLGHGAPDSIERAGYEAEMERLRQRKLRLAVLLKVTPAQADKNQEVAKQKPAVEAAEKTEKADKYRQAGEQKTARILELKAKIKQYYDNIQKEIDRKGGPMPVGGIGSTSWTANELRNAENHRDCQELDVLTGKRTQADVDKEARIKPVPALSGDSKMPSGARWAEIEAEAKAER